VYYENYRSNKKDGITVYCNSVYLEIGQITGKNED
jgi:hypothetical protein